MAIVPQQSVVLITGASSGIGKAAAAAFAAAGFITYATARRPETLADLARAGCHTLTLDVTDEASMRAAVEHIDAAHGGVSVLVNNAGYGEYGAFEDLDLDDVRRQFETNVFGLMRLSQLVLPVMRARRAGRIINISSVGGEMALPGGAAYHASKFAVEALSDVMRVEVRPHGIAVILIQPGFVRTRFGDVIMGSRAMQLADTAYPYVRDSNRRFLARLENNPNGGSSPEDIARVIVRAARAAQPRARYKISFLAHALPALRRTLPNRTWDFLLGRLLASAA